MDRGHADKVSMSLASVNIMASTGDGLVVLADHWGRHPSSAQHLVRRLMASYEVSWINTVGTRRPSFSWSDAQRAAGYVMARFQKAESTDTQDGSGPEVLSPLMYPGFRSGWQRAINRRLMQRAIHGSRAARCERTIGVTTLPITADVVGMSGVDRWVYYAVDDFSAWPGLDHGVMRDMEAELVGKVDRVVAVSERIRERVSAMEVEAELLTHGIDFTHWNADRARSSVPWVDDQRPVLLFWGVIDRRLDVGWCERLSSLGHLVLAGPVHDPDPKLKSLEGVTWLGPVAYGDLPALAQRADVLVMPYADLPVTRAMQPLKFKEYLATELPVVARALPAVHDWADAADLVVDEAGLVEAVRRGLQNGLTERQRSARLRLADEGWEVKAMQLDAVIRGLYEPETSRVGMAA